MHHLHRFEQRSIGVLDMAAVVSEQDAIELLVRRLSRLAIVLLCYGFHAFLRLLAAQAFDTLSSLALVCMLDPSP